MATTLIGRLIRLEGRISDDRPITPADGIHWAAIFTPEEKEQLRQLRERYPDQTVGTRGFLEAVSDEDLDILAGFAERVNAWQDTEHEGETPIAAA